MKKAYQLPNERNLLLRKGQLIGWGMADVKNLIKKANRAISENLRAREKMPWPEFECALTCDWFEAIVEKGVTPELLRGLNSRIGHVKYLHVLEPSLNGLPGWRRIANADEIDHPEIGIAYSVAHLLASGAFKKLKRCQLEKCQKFFIGRPDAKWCSKGCGSVYRTKAKRKKDRRKRYS